MSCQWATGLSRFTSLTRRRRWATVTRLPRGLSIGISIFPPRMSLTPKSQPPARVRLHGFSLSRLVAWQPYWQRAGVDDAISVGTGESRPQELSMFCTAEAWPCRHLTRVMISQSRATEAWQTCLINTLAGWRSSHLLCPPSPLTNLQASSMKLPAPSIEFVSFGPPASSGR